MRMRRRASKRSGLYAQMDGVGGRREVIFPPFLIFQKWQFAKIPPFFEVTAWNLAFLPNFRNVKKVVWLEAQTDGIVDVQCQVL